MRTTKPRRTLVRPAFALLEMLVLIWALALILLVGTAILLGAFQMERSVASSASRLAAHSALADQFRADVAQAAAAPERLDNQTASPTCLILRRSDGKHIIYSWNNKQLQRTELAGKETAQQFLAVGPDCTSVEFIRTGAARRVITLRLGESPGERSSARLKEISAALGGDLR